ncbi:hypothetical protein CSB09_01715 [Candidatus Gracilibacteria bacterium]|nr:MAG: hypothetical protein CSB09_01715 [Candidatus Gracilibacteria bacterium]
MNSQNILQSFQVSSLFSQKMKKEIITYFQKLNPRQKNLIIQAIKSEKKIALHFIKSLKNKKAVRFETVKSQVESLQRGKIAVLEQQEQNEAQKQISLLFNSLQTL